MTIRWICLVLAAGVLGSSCGDDPQGGSAGGVENAGAPPPGGVRWHAWANRDSASILERPLFVFLYTRRSFGCRQMAVRCFQDEDLAREINRGTFPVRIDADRHPDLAERLGLGGYPTTAFLTPEGQWITGGTYLDPEDFRRLLIRVRVLFDVPERMADLERERGTLAARIARKVREHTAVDLGPSLLSACLDQTDSALVRGESPGPEGLLAAIEFGKDELRSRALGRLRFLASVEAPGQSSGSLSALAYPVTPDGMVKDEELHLGRCSGLLLAYAASACLGVSGQPEEGIAELRGTSARFAEGLLEGFCADSLLAAGWAGYGSRAGKRVRDGSFYSGWNALAVSGLLAAFDLTREDRFLSHARAVFIRLETATREGGGLTPRTRDAEGPRFLEDQALLVRAALDLHQRTAEAEILQFGRGLCDRMLKDFRSEGGALRDRFPDSGTAVTPAVDRFVPSGNGVAAQVLVRLYGLTREPKYIQAARGIFETLYGHPGNQWVYLGALNRGLGMYLRTANEEE